MPTSPPATAANFITRSIVSAATGAFDAEATAVAVVTPETPREGDMLACVASDVTDLDGDEVTYETSWFVDGLPVEGAADGTLTGAAFDKGQSVSCTALPHDGTEPGAAIASLAVTVVNSAIDDPSTAVCAPNSSAAIVTGRTPSGISPNDIIVTDITRPRTSAGRRAWITV